MMNNLPTHLRFKIIQDGDCWVWIGCIAWNGYGKTTYKHRTVYAHRHIYELTHGPLNKDMVCDHICRNRSCVNPIHIQIVSNKENIARGISPTAINGRKKICSNGHELSNDNIFIRKNGWRGCLSCQRNRDAGRKR